MEKAFFPGVFSFLCGSGCLQFKMPFEDDSVPKGPWLAPEKTDPMQNLTAHVLHHRALFLSFFGLSVKECHTQKGVKNNIDQALFINHWVFIFPLKMQVHMWMLRYAHPPSFSLSESTAYPAPTLKRFHIPYLTERRQVGMSTPTLQMEKLRFREVSYDQPLVTQSGSDGAKMQMQGLSTASPPPALHQKPKQPGQLCCGLRVSPLSKGLYLLYVLSVRHPMAFGKYCMILAMREVSE